MKTLINLILKDWRAKLVCLVAATLLWLLITPKLPSQPTLSALVNPPEVAKKLPDTENKIELSTKPSPTPAARRSKPRNEERQQKKKK